METSPPATGLFVLAHLIMNLWCVLARLTRPSPPEIAEGVLLDLIHALLRPTSHNLYLIDLNSTNGTFVNASQLRHGIAQVIHNHDELAFAGLACVIEVVSPPSHPIELPPPEPSSAEVQPIAKINKPKTGTETVIGVRLDLPSEHDDPDSKT